MPDNRHDLGLRSERLELIAATATAIEAELQNPLELETLLQARLPDKWPPPEMDEPVLRLFLSYLRDDAMQAGWRAWYFVLVEGDQRILVGNGGFKGPADAGGMVELGYSVSEEFQKRGICTEAVEALISWAFSHKEVLSVRAETDHDNLASIRVMEKSGLQYVGIGSNDEEVRYAITRERFRQTD